MTQGTELKTILIIGSCGFMGTNLVEYHPRKVTLRTWRQPKTEPEVITDYGEYLSVSNSMIDPEHADVEKLEGDKNAAIPFGT